LLLASTLSIIRFGVAGLIDSQIYYLVLIFMITYLAAIWLHNTTTWKYSKTLILAVIITEIILFSYITANSPKSLNAGYLASQSGYFDNANEAISYLNQREKGNFYRLEKKDYESVFLSDALFQNYFGTKSYHSFNNIYYLRFLDNMEVSLWHPIPAVYHYIKGFGERVLLDTLVGVKYIIVKNDEFVPPGYKYIKSFGDVHLFENINFLPLGFCLNKYIRQDTFMNLPLPVKDQVLLKSYILEPGKIAPDGLTELSIEEYQYLKDLDIDNSVIHQKSYIYEYEINVEKLRINTFELEHFTHNNIKGYIELEAPQLLFFSIPFDEGWTIYVNGEKRETELVNFGFIGVYLEPGQHYLELKYWPPYLKEGIILSLMGIILYAIVIYRQSKIAKYRRRNLVGFDIERKSEA